MGRTTPTIGVIQQQERSALTAFRRSLPNAYQRVFDEMWSYTSKYLMPCGCADYPLPLYIFLLTIKLQQHKVLEQLELEIDLLNEQENYG